VESSICATPAEGVATLALSATAPEGRFVSIAGSPEGDLRHRWLYKVHYFLRGDYHEIASLAAEGKVSLESFITHTFPLEDLSEAFRMRFLSKEETLKVVVLTRFFT